MRETILLDALEEIENVSKSLGGAKNIAIKALREFQSSAPESEFWTDEVVLEFAKQYRFSSSRISLQDFKEGKGFPYSPAPESGQKEGLRWVKASERLPKKRGEENSVIIRGSNFGNEFVTKGFVNYHEANPTFCFVLDNKTYLNNKNIEWLDASSAPESGGEEKELTVAQKVVMDLRIVKLKEQGATEADILLMEMVELNKKLYEQILDSNISSRFNQLAKKAIAFDNRPESGGEEKDYFFTNLRMAIIDACNNWREENERETIPAKAFHVIANNVAKELTKDIYKDFVPSVQSSDVKTSTSSNSIEEEWIRIEDKKPTEADDVIIVMGEHLGGMPDFVWIEDETGETKKPFAYDKHDNPLYSFNEIRWWKKFIPPSSEQEDKRSVATKSNQGGEADNQICKMTGERCKYICVITDCFLRDEEKKRSSLSKEEWKDEEDDEQIFPYCTNSPKKTD